MALFRGRKKKYCFAERKRKNHPTYTKRWSKIKNLKTSTPLKSEGKRIYPGSSGKKFTPSCYKRVRLFSPIIRASSGKKCSSARKSLTFGIDNDLPTDHDFFLEISGRDSLNSKIEDTYLYENGRPLLNDSAIDNIAAQEDIIRTGEDDRQSNDDIHEVLDEVLNIFNQNNVKEDFVSFFKLVSQNKFPMNNVAFILFLDAVKWFGSNDTRAVRYSDTSLKLFWLGKRLFGGKFLRFMGGPKHETSNLLGNSQLSPLDSKINFACPSE